MATVASGTLGSDSYIRGGSGFVSTPVNGVNVAVGPTYRPTGATWGVSNGFYFRIVKPGSAWTPGAFKGMLLTTTKKYDGSALSSDWRVVDNGANWILVQIPLALLPKGGAPFVFSTWRYILNEYPTFKTTLQGSGKPTDNAYVISSGELANPFYYNGVDFSTASLAHVVNGSNFSAYTNPWSVSDVAPAAVAELVPDGGDPGAAESNATKMALLYAHNIGKSDGISPDMMPRGGVVNAIADSGGATWSIVDRGAWSGAITYAAGDQVTYLGKTWICLSINGNNIPPNYPALWLQRSAQVALGAWSNDELIGQPATLIRAADFSTETALITDNVFQVVTADWTGAYPVLGDRIVIGAIAWKIWTPRMNCGLAMRKKEFEELWLKLRFKTLDFTSQLVFVKVFIDGRAARNIPLNDKASSSEGGVSQINGVAAVQLDGQAAGGDGNELLRFPVPLGAIGVDIQFCFYGFEADAPVEFVEPMMLKFKTLEARDNPR